LFQQLQTLLEITQERVDLLGSLSHAHVQHECRVSRKVQQLGFLQKTADTFVLITPFSKACHNLKVRHTPHRLKGIAIKKGKGAYSS